MSYFQPDKINSDRNIKRFIAKDKIGRIGDFEYIDSKYFDLIEKRSGIKFEVKEDLRHIETGNAYLEVECNRKRSCLSITDASLYIILLHTKSNFGCVIMPYMVHVNDLKKLILSGKYKIKRGGEGAIGYPIPSSDIQKFCQFTARARYELQLSCDYSMDRHYQRNYNNLR